MSVLIYTGVVDGEFNVAASICQCPVGARRKVLLPTPPKMSKKERREQFEAQIKAKDEMQKQQLQQQLQDPAAAYQYYQQQQQQQQGFIEFPGQVDYPVPAQPEVMYQDGTGMSVAAPYQDGTAVVPMQPGPGVPMAVPSGMVVVLCHDSVLGLCLCQKVDV